MTLPQDKVGTVGTGAEKGSRLIEATRSILFEEASRVGHDFISTLTGRLAAVLDADSVLVGALGPGKPPIVDTVAVWVRGRPGTNFSYPLDGLPFSEVDCGTGSVPPGQSDRAALHNIRPEGHLRVAVVDREGNHIGELAALFRCPPPDASIVHSTLALCMTRVASELVRMADEAALLRAQAELSAIVGATSDVLTVFDREGRCVEIHAANHGDFLPDSREWVGRTLDGLFSRDDAEMLSAKLQETIRSRTTMPLGSGLSLGNLPPGSEATLAPLPGDRVLLVVRNVSRWRRTEAELETRLRFEELVAAVSAEFVRVQGPEMDRAIVDALRRIAESLGVDRSTLFLARPSRPMESTHSWTCPGAAALSRKLAIGEFPWVAARVARGEVVVLRRLDELPPEAVADREALHALGDVSVVTVPLVIAGSLIGAISLTTQHQEREWTKTEVARLRAIGEVFVIALARRDTEEALSRSREQLRDLAARMNENLEHERTAIARRVHDELGQLLTAVRMDATVLGGRIAPNDRVAHERVRTMLDELDSGVDVVQAISTELRPVLLDVLGLGPAIEEEVARFQNRTGVECITDVRISSPQLDDRLSIALFRVCQELLTNIVRHARATRVKVELREDQRSLVLRVEDNGVGIATEAISSWDSIGILGMRERIEPLGGRIEFRGEAGHGTSAVVEVPLDRGSARRRRGRTP